MRGKTARDSALTTTERLRGGVRGLPANIKPRPERNQQELEGAHNVQVQSAAEASGTGAATDAAILDGKGG